MAGTTFHPAAVPPPFDAAYYRARNPDLDLPGNAEARAHYESSGRSEGRVASPAAEREGLVALLAAEPSVLEIGPFCSPLLTGPNVAYLDILDAAELRARALSLGLDAGGCPERIDYVGTLAQVDRRFAAVVGSHSIEHQPDLVTHLAEVARILEPGGRYYLIVPDKRWSFDHFLPESGLPEVLAAYQERRTVHTLPRVIEHGALVTHNDPVRHWRGDHGDPAQDRTRRIRVALDSFQAGAGGYIDVHAWYFTPESFRDTIASLGDLGLCALDPVAVYDTPRDRLEFCAVLQLRRPPLRLPKPPPGEAMDIILFQTADAFNYAPMLAVTAPSAIEFCRRHGHRYESFVGLKRGFWSWQASYNRIVMLTELIERGFTGWAIYLDADAYVVDLDFDLRAYLADKGDRAAILAESGVTSQLWDINDGIAFINLGHPIGRQLVTRWSETFHEITDQELREATSWLGTGNDQDLIQRILRDDPVIASAVLVENRDFINSRHACFIRQHLRSETTGMDQRIRTLATEVHAIFSLDGRGPADLVHAPPPLEERDRAALRNPPASEVPRLVEMPTARPDPELARRIGTAWASTPGRPAPPPHQADFACLLDSGDHEAIAQELAQLGRVRLAQGFLGGARQHQRWATDPVFAYHRGLRTRDALLSLAEGVGAVRPENVELGPWGESARLRADVLFDRVQDRLAVDLSPPVTIGGWLGIACGGSIVLHHRIVEAIHAAWRIGQVTDLLGARQVVEIGGGAGLTAHYASRFGIRDYALVDTPLMHAVQAYALAAGDDMLLAGEPERPAALRLRPDVIGRAQGALLFNEDTLPDMAHEDAIALLVAAREAGAVALLSVNHEATPAGQSPSRPVVRDLVETAGGFRLIQRHNHQLRPGYMEELFVTV
jgi:SAM-dependent methyltransferase